MKYATVCSGIEAPSVAWHKLGWKPVWFSEIERFPSAVLKYHYSKVPNLGDMTKIHENERYQKSAGAIDVFCGGTPCQSFSVAGLRKGMEDPRGNLALHFLRIADEIRPRWVVWENVPGVLSSNGGRDFGAFLGALGKLGYGWAYRILDAQYFGVAQRRRRVFVVGYIGGWRGAAAVLFDTESLSGNPAPGRQEGQEPAGRIAFGIDEECNGIREQFGTLLKGGQGGTRQTIAFGFNGDQSEKTRSMGERIEQCPCLRADGPAHVAFAQNQIGEVRVGHIANTINTNSNASGRNTPMCFNPSGRDMPRRLTPRECERLQGFPDDYTLIPYGGASNRRTICPDGVRYKALGNSMAVPVMEWIGERINGIENGVF